MNPSLLRWLLPVIFSSALMGAEACNGTTVLIELDRGPDDAKLTYEGRTFPLLEHPVDKAKQIALVPVSYRSEPGERRVCVQRGETSTEYLIRVKKGAYDTEELTVAQSKVTPGKKAAERIAREYREAQQVYGTITPQRYWHSAFVSPMRSAVTSRFGTARTYNGTLKSFHAGTDFKAPVGTPVTAVNDGVVAIASDRYYAGNTVIVDHGEGLYSCYYHLSRLDVKAGDRVARDKQIGLSGMTGRVTGPHLHFAFMLYGVQVDPLQLIDTVNALFGTEKPLR